MTLIEIMVVLAIMLAVMGSSVAAFDAVFMVEQQASAKELTLHYQRLRDEAILRNLTYRISFHMKEGKYEITMAPPGQLIHETYEDREEFEEEAEDRDFFLTDDEKERMIAYNEAKGFKQIEGHWSSEFVLPEGIRFGGVFTPQYEEMVMYEEWEEYEEDEKPFVVHSHIFPNGFVEHTIVTIVDIDDPEDGFTVEVEPLTGNVVLHSELIDYEDSFDFVPEEGPTLAN
jgi:hypothetical protein